MPPISPGPQGEAPLSLAGVQVFFDGQPAPVPCAQSQQINAVSPVELDGQTSTSIVVQYNGVSFGPIVAPVVFAAPDIFRLNPGVSTQAAAVNQDGTVNSAANPAPRGSVVSLYGSGFGLTDPACAKGSLNAAAVNLAPMDGHRNTRRSNRRNRPRCNLTPCRRA